LRRLILILSIVVGLAAAVLGPLLGAILAVVGWLGRTRASTDLLLTVTIASGVTLLSLGFGLALAWDGWAALRGRPSRLFRLVRWGWWLLALLVVIGLGQAALSAGARQLVPVLHIAAGALPAFLLLSLALGSARRGGGAITARPMVGSLAWGGLGGVGLAMFLEVLLLMIGAVAVSVWLAVTQPDLLQQLQAGVLEYQESGDLQSLTDLMPQLFSRPVVLGLLGALGVIVPLAEEGVKTLAVPLVALTGRRLSRLDGFLLGAAAGAGFAVFEGVMNGVLSLSMPSGWALLMLVRAGTAAIHCGATGMVGLGWAVILSERRWALGIGLGAAGVALHGAWNLAAGAQTLIGLPGLGQFGVFETGGQSLLALLPIALLGLVWIGAALLVALLPRRLASVAQSVASDPSLSDQSRQAQDEPVDQEGVEKRPAAPGNPAEEGPAEDRA
jgi:RsiW-degrading membrane proteinase PrsW (M82 family)